MRAVCAYMSRLGASRLASSVPASPHQSAAIPKTRHLLRALLREASYLPDANARTYFHHYIVSRFKAYQPKQNATASSYIEALQKPCHKSFRRRQTAIIEQRARPLLRKGQKALSFLRRANQGELSCVQKVLWLAYGRIGRRKYALLSDLLKPDPVTALGVVSCGSQPTAPLQTVYYSKKRYLQFFDPPKALPNKKEHVIDISDSYARLRAVIRSQYQNGISINRELKSPAFKTPINNVWQRRMPIRRARNNVKRWYAETMTRLLPPLPAEEWDSIYEMMLGVKRISLIRPRPRALEHQHLLQTESSEERFAHILSAGLALNKTSKADRPSSIPRAHKINPRLMRRLYHKILTLCCKLEYDEEQTRWTVTWGEKTKLVNPRSYHMSETDESLFAGVDARGRTLETSCQDENLMQPALSRRETVNHVRFPFFTDHLPKAHPLRKELIHWKAKIAAADTKAEDNRGR